MKITRRGFIYMSYGAWASRMLGQHGVASRGLKQQPRPAPSGRPFDAHFVDIAESAGLTTPIIYGGVEHKEYILEADGCGCAFIDYDNDGWMDIFLLTGTRLHGAPVGTTNRLYKNNRDREHSAQNKCRTDLHSHRCCSRQHRRNSPTLHGAGRPSP